MGGKVAQCLFFSVMVACGGSSTADVDANPTGDAATTDAGTGAGVDYDFLFDQTRVVEAHLTIALADWNALDAEPEVYVPARFEYDGEVVDNVGVRNKGNVSLQFAGAKRSFKVKFSEYEPGRRYHGIKRMNFHNGFKDPTIMRENLAYPAVAAAGGYASRTSHVSLFITVPGMHDREFWGLYINTEQVDKTFLRDRFADPEGNLYKGGNLFYQGPNVSDYVPGRFEPKTNEMSDHTRLVEFIDILANTPDATFVAELEAIFEVEPFLSWLAANTLLANMDNMANGGGGNGYFYLDPSTNKFNTIVWDMNEAFGSTSEGLDVDELLDLSIDLPVTNPQLASPLIERVLAQPAYMASYRAKLQALVDDYFSVANLEARITALRTMTRPLALQDTRKHYSAAQYDQSFDSDVTGLPKPPYPADNIVIGLRRFIAARVQSVTTQLGN